MWHFTEKLFQAHEWRRLPFPPTQVLIGRGRETEHLSSIFFYSPDLSLRRECQIRTCLFWVVQLSDGWCLVLLIDLEGLYGVVDFTCTFGAADWSTNSLSSILDGDCFLYISSCRPHGMTYLHDKYVLSNKEGVVQNEKNHPMVYAFRFSMKSPGTGVKFCLPQRTVERNMNLHTWTSVSIFFSANDCFYWMEDHFQWQWIPDSKSRSSSAGFLTPME